MYNSKFFNYFWIFILGSIFGVLSEPIWRLVTRGIFVTRVGVLYGPFNPVYGLALVLMTLFLLHFSNKNIVFLVILASLLGGSLEYFSSYLQEFFFGSVSWDYSKFAFNIHGRANIPYAFLWGLIGVVWIKIFYPAVNEFIKKIPKSPGVLITYLMLIFMMTDITISAAAVFRSSERSMSIPAQNNVQLFLDRHYPDDVLERVYTNMKHF